MFCAICILCAGVQGKRVGGVKFAEALMGPTDQPLPQQDQGSEEEIGEVGDDSDKDSNLSLERELLDGESMQDG